MSPDFWSSELLIYVGCATTALAFLLREILWPRLLVTFLYRLFCIIDSSRKWGVYHAFVECTEKTRLWAMVHAPSLLCS